MGKWKAVGGSVGQWSVVLIKTDVNNMPFT